MKKLLFYFLIILIISCKPVQKTNVETQGNIINTGIITENLTNCPENSTCTFELIPNKSIEFKKDNIGIEYPIISDGTKTLLKYTFNKNFEKGLQDGFYTEINYAELENIENITLKDKDLQNVKLYFGRLCYCKGETGYFPIETGTFSIQKISKNEVNFNIDFTISQVPQIISNIKETISIK